ncbi:MAG: stage II sporulation protein D [Christensenellales bacterium]|jgi:stage II sporulation protein D
MRMTMRERRMKRRRIKMTVLAGLLMFASSFAFKLIINYMSFDDSPVLQSSKEQSVPDSAGQPQLDPKETQNSAAGEPSLERLSSRQESAADFPLYITVYDHDAQVKRVMLLDEYVYHCLSGEVPASYHDEALKAQAVAIRTYAVSKMGAYGGSGCSKSSGADVCTDSSHCQTFARDEDLKKQWGDDYNFYSQKMKAAVAETSGLVALHEGKPILAMFHANSGGITEDVEAIYSDALPYLRSVDGFDPLSESTFSFTAKEAAGIINSAYPDAKVKERDLDEQLIVKSRLASGRVESVICGEIQLTGTQLRRLFSLPSSNLIIRYPGGDVEFTTYGRGHGVGLSQEGAQEMAKAGHSYEEILGHYYQGVTIDRLPLSYGSVN